MVTRMDKRVSNEGLFGGVDGGDDTIVGESERLIKGQAVSRDEVLRRLQVRSDVLRGRDAGPEDSCMDGQP